MLCIYVYIFIYTYIYMYIYIYINMCMHVFGCLCEFGMFVLIYVHIFI